MSTPKVLVSISCFNHEKFLQKSLESILNQTYKNLDICVINDGSNNPDEIIKIVESAAEKDARVRFINFSKNQGKWSALNEAIRTSDSDLCTAHDADDISLPNRIERQVKCLIGTNTLHNLCGFRHCWNESDVEDHLKNFQTSDQLQVIGPEDVSNMVSFGRNTPGINHYFTGNFETAGVSALFYRQIWDMGVRFNPPGSGLRVLVSEDSDFNFRVTSFFGKTSILAEQQYCYRRNTSTNKELV
jgi:glycosyltransferase involved in cell wall biosynthesis